MHTALFRANALLTYAGTVLAGLAILATLTGTPLREPVNQLHFLTAFWMLQISFTPRTRWPTWSSFMSKGCKCLKGVTTRRVLQHRFLLFFFIFYLFIICSTYWKIFFKFPKQIIHIYLEEQSVTDLRGLTGLCCVQNWCRLVVSLFLEHEAALHLPRRRIYHAA